MRNGALANERRLVNQLRGNGDGLVCIDCRDDLDASAEAGDRFEEEYSRRQGGKEVTSASQEAITEGEVAK